MRKEKIFMQNEIYNGEIFLPADLGSATDRELSNISSALKTDLPFQFWREIGISLKRNNTTADKDILLFFSALRERAKKHIENISLAELFADDEEVKKTLDDLYLKARHINAFKGPRLRLNDLINISSSYLASVGAHTPELFSNGCDCESFALFNESNDKTAEISLDLSPLLPYGYVKENKNEAQNKKHFSLVHGIELLLITANGKDSDEYSKSCKELLSDERIKELCLTTDTIGDLGLIGALSKLPCGAYIELDKLFAGDEEPSLFKLVTEFAGQLLAVAAHSRGEELKALAEEYGLYAVSAAKVLEHPFLIISNNGKTANIEKPLIYRTIRMALPVSLKKDSEVFKPTTVNSRFTLVRKDGHTEVFDGTVSPSKNVLLSALSSEAVSFTDGINIALDSLFLLLAKGADRRNVEFSFKIRTSYEDVQKMLSAILGVYRVMMELCIPDAESTIEFTGSNKENELLFCSAGIKTGKNLANIPDTFSQNSIGNKLYLLSFKRLNDSSPAFMPDFAALRNTCDKLYKLISDGKALSVKSFNTSIGKAINEMGCGNFEIIPEGTIPINDSLFMQGFLVETLPHTVLDLPLLGRILDFVPQTDSTEIENDTNEDELNITEISTSN